MACLKIKDQKKKKNQRAAETHWNWISHETMETLKQLNPQTKTENKKPKPTLFCKILEDNCKSREKRTLQETLKPNVKECITDVKSSGDALKSDKSWNHGDLKTIEPTNKNRK